MMAVREWLAIGLMASGGFFFAAAAVGLLRFPDLFSRVHAVTKADTIGLALLVIGLIVGGASWQLAVRLALVSVLVMAASATTCTLIARAARRGS